jgi:hypothetical protein
VIIRTPEELAPLTLAQLEELARENLTWRREWTAFNARGHAAFKDSGHPNNWDGKRIANRTEYLKERLTRRLKRSRKDQVIVLYDKEGKAEAERLKKEEEAKLLAERAKKPLVKNLKQEVKAETKARIEEWTKTPSEAVHFIVTLGGQGRRHGVNLPKDVWMFQRAQDSPSQRICMQQGALKGKDLIEGLKLLEGKNEILEQIEALARQLELPKGVNLGTTDLQNIGRLQLEDKWGGGYFVFTKEERYGATCVKVETQGRQFHFRISDLYALAEVLGDEDDYVVVKKKDLEKAREKLRQMQDHVPDDARQELTELIESL